MNEPSEINSNSKANNYNMKKIADVIKDWEETNNNNEKQPANNVRRKKKAPVKYGTKEFTHSSKGFKVTMEHRTWHLYIRNLNQFIKTDDLMTI